MKRVLPIAVAALVGAGAGPAESITIEAGWSLPNGRFDEPARTDIEKGAESSYTFGLKFRKPLVFFDLVGELSYVQFGEEYAGPAKAAEEETYTHTFIPVTIGLRKNILGTLPVHPYVGGAVGLYGYMARGQALVPEPGGGFTEEDFTAVIRPGLNFAAGLMIDVPFSFDLAAEVKYHLMVFQGVGDDLADREYPYAIDVDSLTFTTLTVGLAF